VLPSLRIKVDRWLTEAVRGCLQQILADLSGMSMPAGESPPPNASVSTGNATVPEPTASAPLAPRACAARGREIGGRAGPEPTRFGDWEKNGRCIDF
jgi:hypothetical protein